MHCNLATGGPGAAMRHAPFGRPRHPLGTFPCGKVPRPPAGGRNLPQGTGFLWKAREKSLPCFLPYHKSFRLCGGDQGAFRSPPGPLRGPTYCRRTKPPTRNRFLAQGREKSLSCFLPYHKRFRLCGGDQGAFRSPPRPLRGPTYCRRTKPPTRNRFLAQGKGKGLSYFSRITKGFASAEATKGLSARPLETFGPHTC